MGFRKATNAMPADQVKSALYTCLGCVHNFSVNCVVKQNQL
jgi:transcription elongation factor Elf1